MAFKLHFRLFVLLVSISLVSLLLNIWHIFHTSRRDCDRCTATSVQDRGVTKMGQRKTNLSNFSGNIKVPLFKKWSTNSSKSTVYSRIETIKSSKTSLPVHRHYQQNTINLDEDGKHVDQKPSKKTSKTKKTECTDPFRQEFVDRQIYLCYTPLSRLGNQMFLYASAYGIAQQLNRTLVIGESQITEYFSVTAKIVKDYKCVIKGTKRVMARWNCAYDASLMNLPSGENICVGKHLQSFRYFEKVGKQVRKEMTFRKEYRDNATRIIDASISVYKKRRKISKSSYRPVLVGVHVRRGDMVNHQYGFDVATPEYIEKAMKYFREKYGQVLFLVCSNDMRWSKKHVRGDDVIYIEKNHFSLDMAVLVRCDHTLSTVGTFSWWVGYLTGGETVYYKWPAREGTEHRSHFSQNYTDFFPSSWIGMR